jgi:hypothetical protein
VGGLTLLVFFLGIEQVSNIAELFGRILESLDLLAKLGLFSLFLAQHLMDISHESLLWALYVPVS